MALEFKSGQIFIVVEKSRNPSKTKEFNCYSRIIFRGTCIEKISNRKRATVIETLSKKHESASCNGFKSKIFQIAQYVHAYVQQL